MTLCLNIIDRQEVSAPASAVPLLRKLAPNLEAEFCTKLEQRLAKQPEISSIATQVLATAGTDRATEVLARHPEVWGIVFESTGYLSAAFENLLVDWIQNGSQNQSYRAAELITQQLSRDRFNQLADLLSTLPTDRRQHLAILLLTSSENHRAPFWYHEVDEADRLMRFCKCVVSIKEPAAYFRKRSPDRERTRHPWEVSPAPACLYIDDRTIKSNPTKMCTHLINGLAWTRLKPVMFSWLASCLAFTSIGLDDTWRLGLLWSALVIFAIGAVLPIMNPPWVVGIRYVGFARVAVISIHSILGAPFIYSVGASHTASPTPAFSLLSTVALSFVFLLAGHSTSFKQLLFRFEPRWPFPLNHSWWIMISWFTYLLMWVVDTLFLSNYILSLGWPKYLALGYLLWAMYDGSRLWYSSHRLHHGAVRAFREFPSFRTDFIRSRWLTL